MDDEKYTAASVKIPGEYGDFKDHWRNLAQGGRLFEVFRQSVQRRASEQEFQQLVTDLDSWRDFICDSGDIRAGKHQWNTARTLIELASLAARQPRPSLTEGLNAWQLDAVCALLATPRTALGDARASISVLLEQDKAGCLARLDVELMADGAGAIYADPQSNWFIEFDDDFLEAAAAVWQQVKQEFTPDEQQRLAKIDARFRLTHASVPNYFNSRPEHISGTSAQTAFYLCLHHAATSYLGEADVLLLDQSVAASATLDESQKLGGVGALTSKIEAAYLKGLAMVIVAEGDEAKAQAALDAAKARASDKEYASATEVISCATVADALALLRDRAREKEAVRRHEHKLCSELHLLDQSVPIEKLYQVLPLLREVKKERLMRSKESPEGDGAEDRFTGLRGSETLRWEESLRDEQIAYEQHPLAKVFTDFRSIVKDAKSDAPRFIVLGPPGSGKTTLEQFLAWACGARRNGANGNEDALRLREASGIAANLVPARVTLRDWEKWATKSSDPEQSLAEYLAGQYKDTANAPTAKQWLRWLHRGEVLLLLDGLDEIAGDASFVTALKTTLARFKDCPTVLTCRTVSFEQHRALDADLPIFTISGLNEEQRNAFVRAYPARHEDRFDRDKLIEQLDTALQMRPLAANPLLLSIICYVVDSSKVILLPATRGELYNEAIDRLLERDKGEKNPMPLIRKRRIVERAALTLFAGMDEQRQLTFDEASLVDALTDAAEQEGYRADPAPIADALLKDFVKNSGILRGNSERGYIFLHLTIQEFLAASAIARVVNDKKDWQAEIRLADRCVTPHQFVDRKSWGAQWSEVIKLLAGQLRDPAPILNLLADEKKDDDFRHRLALDAMCLPEIKSATRNSKASNINQITDAAFSFWLKHYKAGTLEALPHFAKALPSLAQVNGCVKGVSLLTLLCEWLRYAEEDVRYRAAEALGRMGEAAARHPDVLPLLVAALRDARWPVRSSAAEALGRMMKQGWRVFKMQSDEWKARTVEELSAWEKGDS